jgi:hypothetical protein
MGDRIIGLIKENVRDCDEEGGVREDVPGLQIQIQPHPLV